MKRKWRSVVDSLAGPSSPRPRSDSPDRMLRYAYGIGSTRDGKVDTMAAAEALGVSRRTAQRWMKQGIPSARRSRAAGRLEADVDARHAMKEAERRARRRAKLTAQGARVTVKGTFAISSDRRPRELRNLDLAGEDMEAIFAGVDEEGEQGAQAALDEAIQSVYVSGLELEQLDEIEWF